MRTFHLGIGICSTLIWIAIANAFADTPPLTHCDLDGKLQSIVEKILPKTLALQDTSFGVALVDTQSGQSLCEDYVQADQNIYPASTIKTLIAVATLRQVDLGRLDLDQEITIDQPNNPEECGDWNCAIYGNGKKVSLRNLLSDMITLSNNLATNQLIDLVGRDYITNTAKEMNAASLAVYRKVYNEVDPEPSLTVHNTATARGYVTLFREIVSGAQGILTSSSRELLIDLLGKQFYHDAFNQEFYPRIKFYHKDGATSQMRGDTGFYYLDSQQRIAVILVGLENFASYSDCSSGPCATSDADQALSEIGLEVLNLTQALSQ